MDHWTRKTLRGFYENELTNNILSFWLPRCEDTAWGGYFNCFDNRGETLVSRDKYAWSQGRFVWMFSKLAAMDGGVFTQAQRARFLALARSGVEFLQKHCLLGPEDWRVCFLTDETGAHKPVSPGARLDMSIYADCFVIAGFARYAQTARDFSVYGFAKRLYQSAIERWRSGAFQTLPYPLSPQYRAHGLPMIFQNVAKELFEAAVLLDSDFTDTLKADLAAFSGDILDNFTDSQGLIREVIAAEGGFLPNLLGEHINPGHVIEDVWFHLDSADILGRPERVERLAHIARRTLETGWDAQYGGILHYAGLPGGEPAGCTDGVAGEPMLQQVLAGWGDKLWWVHSEALYTTLRLYLRTGSADFLDWHRRLMDYTFDTFPNPDRELREWVQIRQRDGSPQDKVVALPVKDPYHIVRNLIGILELLWEAE